MVLKLWPKRKMPIDEEIEILQERMRQDAEGGNWSSYEDKLALLNDMVTVKNHLKRRSDDPKSRVEYVKTFMVIAGGLAEILLIMNYEKIDNFATKAFGRVIRPKI